MERSDRADAPALGDSTHGYRILGRQAPKHRQMVFLGGKLSRDQRGVTTCTALGFYWDCHSEAREHIAGILELTRERLEFSGVFCLA